MRNYSLSILGKNGSNLLWVRGRRNNSLCNLEDKRGVSAHSQGVWSEIGIRNAEKRR
ncbi:MAG: hypothetical protein IT209_01945 [Armatimonadetes bacterium]|nr:hypothetical protein [Armatimonadota bacterium]